MRVAKASSRIEQSAGTVRAAMMRVWAADEEEEDDDADEDEDDDRDVDEDADEDAV